MKPHAGLSAGGDVRRLSSDHVIFIPGISSRIWFASVLFRLNSPTVFISMIEEKNIPLYCLNGNYGISLSDE